MPFKQQTHSLEPAPILSLDAVAKTFVLGANEVPVLREISFNVSPGETISLTGPSGSGKTTLLGLCAGLDRPSQGSILLNGRRLEDLNEDQRARLRIESVGFIFQNFRLLPSLTALQNVMVPADILGRSGARERAIDLLGQVGLSNRLHHYPAQLSGGEQQRVALARAFINEPAILFADEPTGNLDAETSARIVPLLFGLNERLGTTLLVATHDSEVASLTQRAIRLRGGHIED